MVVAEIDTKFSLCNPHSLLQKLTGDLQILLHNLGDGFKNKFSSFSLVTRNKTAAKQPKLQLSLSSYLLDFMENPQGSLFNHNANRGRVWLS